MTAPLPESEIRRIVGLAPDRPICQNRCPDNKERRPCNCFPGFNMDAAVRVVRSMEAHYGAASTTISVTTEAPPLAEDDKWAAADMEIHRLKVSGELQRRADHRALLEQIQHGEYR